MTSGTDKRNLTPEGVGTKDLEALNPSVLFKIIVSVSLKPLNPKPTAVLSDSNPAMRARPSQVAGKTNQT